MTLLFSSVSPAARKPGEMPPPRLMAPGDLVETGPSGVEFRWGNESGGNIDHYDFHLYLGPQTYEKDLILKKEIPRGTSSIWIESSYFKPGETYSWSLRTNGSKRSMFARSVFKIKK